MTTVVGIDPGKWQMALGVLEDNTIVRTHVVKGPEGDHARAAAHIAFLAARYVSAIGPGITVCVEKMSANFTGRGHAAKDDVLDVAFTSGAVAAALVDAGHDVRLVPVNMWKGSVPKKIHQQRIKKRLSEEEMQVIHGASHDEVDAAGIALWKVGRL